MNSGSQGPSVLAIVLLASTLAIPPLSWTCPMHPEVVEGERGTCPICRMTLVPIRLDSVWSCPVHAAVARDGPGLCPVCQRELVRVTMSVTWTCAGQAAPPSLEPGACADGSAAVAHYAPRPHGNHNPQHGGQFFMAADNWHHLEGVYTGDGTFRVYLYDDFSRPLTADKVRQVSARARSGSRDMRLAADAAGGYLETELHASDFPVDVTAWIKFGLNERESRFDFRFSEHSVESSQAREPDREQAAKSESSIHDLDVALHARATAIGEAIAQRRFSEIWVPALQAKNIALAIDDKSAESAFSRRKQISIAVRNIVRAAWMLDNYGDLGDADQIADGYNRFTAAVTALDEALQEPGPR